MGRFGSPSLSRAPRRWLTGPRAAVSASAIVFVLVACLPQVRAAFTATTSNGASSLTAAASFPDYPTAVNNDHPLFYHRLDDPAGSVTASDSSGNGLTGVYGTSSNGQGWTGLWPMDENTGTTAKDLSGAATTHDLTLNGSTWTSSGRSRSALAFNGTSGYAATASSVVNTNASFTVAAWVYLTDTSVSRTAVSQDGTNASGFELGYDASVNRWAFEMRESDSGFAWVDEATSTAAPTLNTWTQLLATFDATGQMLNLFVNGSGTAAAHTTANTWNATGAFEVGAGKVTSRTDFWQGTVDNVRILQGLPGSAAASAQELTIGPTGGASSSWQFDENSGTTTSDSSGYLNTGTLGSSVSWSTTAPTHTNYGTSWVDLPGDANGYISGAASGVDTSNSFSVAAWVYLDHTTLAAMGRVAVSQSGSVKSGFMLKYNQYATRWEFDLTQGAADNYSPTYDIASSASNSAALTTWTHLVGVYDATAQTLTLYVNGTAQTGASHTSVFNATGPLQVGRVKEFGAWQTGSTGNEAWGPWAGRVDDVRVFRRALGPQEVTAVYNGGMSYSSLGLPGALQGAQQGQTGSTAMGFGATKSRASYNPTSYTNPTTYSVECWFRTNTAPNSGSGNGVTLLNFGNKATGNSTISDRKLFLDTSGHLGLGTSNATSNAAVSPATYLDGTWHHAVGTVSPTSGLNLYVDGKLVASASYTAPANYTGFWRFGGDTWSGTWPADYYHLGELDEIALYGTVLSAQQVAWHYHANH